MSNANDYVGRRVDVAAFQGVKPKGEIQLTQALALPGESGVLTTGIVKLAQRFLLELLTERGSFVYRPARGSTFLLEVRGGYVRTVTDLYAAIARGLIDVQKNLRSEESIDDPLDERYGAATVASVELSGDTAKVFITLRSQDTNAVVVLPIAVSLI